MTDFSRLPFGLDGSESDGLFRQFLRECGNMTPAEKDALQEFPRS